MKTRIRMRKKDGKLHEALMFACPGCAELNGGDGIHILAIESELNAPGISPTWKWNGNRTEPTLTPSILTRGNGVCHSFLRDGKFEFLNDCTHSMAGETVPMPDLPKWAQEL